MRICTKKNSTGTRGLRVGGSTLALAIAACFASAPALSQQSPPEVNFEVTQFQITGDNPLGEERAQAVLQPYLGAQHGIDRLEAARAALADALRASGYSFYHVTLPPQDTKSVIRIDVQRIKLKTVEVQGQRYFSEANIRASVPALVPGESPDIREVARELELADDNPAKHTSVALRASDNEASMDATLQTNDRDPLSFTVGYNTTGNDDQGGRSRVVGYIEDANLFGLDQVGSIAYTTSPNDPNQVKQYGLYYKAPIYAWDGAFSASYSYSSVSTGALGSGEVITGAGHTTGLSYTEFLYPVGAYRSSVAVGIDDKLFSSPVLAGFGETGGDVRSRPVSLTYVASYAPGWATMNLNVEVDHNISGGADDDQAAYTANRAGATPDWNALRVFGSYSQPLGQGWTFSTRARAQYTNDALIAGEQFGLGGEGSIRGAEERAVTGDTGGAISFEIYTPEVYPGTRFLGFSDNGFVERYHVIPGETAHEVLESLGLGMRYTWTNAVNMSLDYGVITRGSRYPEVPAGSSRVHANVTYTF